MKRLKIVLLIIFFILTVITADHLLIKNQTDDKPGNSVLMAQVKKEVDEWIAKVNGKVITIDEFEREFRVHVYALPISEEDKDRYKKDTANKKKFLSNLINEYLIYNAAVKAGYEKRSDVQDLIKAVSRRAIIQVYLNEKIEPLLKDVPDEQIEAIYNQNKKLFAGVDIDVARQQIRMQLLQKQYNEQLNDLIDTLMGEAKVVRNPDIQL